MASSVVIPCAPRDPRVTLDRGARPRRMDAAARAGGHDRHRPRGGIRRQAVRSPRNSCRTRCKCPGREGCETVAFTLNEIIAWGRSFDEYRRFFALEGDDLARPILGC